jgi:hypothetical protein
MMEGRLNKARQIAIDDAWIDTLSLCLYVNIRRNDVHDTTSSTWQRNNRISITACLHSGITTLAFFTFTAHKIA